MKMQHICIILVVVLCRLPAISWCMTAPPRCERIVAPMCQGLGYNTTHMPNLLQHNNQEEAISELEKFNGLLGEKCSPLLRLFVCSVYIPFCTEYVPDAVPACKSICEEVQRDCSLALQRAGFTQLNCSRFPEPTDLCMQKPPDEEDLNLGLVSEMKSTGAYNMKLLHSNNNNGAMRNNKCPHGSILTNSNRCVRIAEQPPSTSTTTDDEFLQYEEDEDAIIVQVWIAIWSILSLIIVLFTLLTFMIQPKRFRWPARPILCLTSCGFIASLLYFLQWMLGTVIYKDNVKPLETWPCIVFALLSTFCEFAFALWWCTFSYVWYLSAAKEWSTEAIEKIAARLHSIIWSLSAVPLVYVLVSNSLRLNKFSGFGEAFSYVLIASQILIVVFGIVLAIFTSLALKDVREALVYAGRSPFKLDRLIYRLGIISLGISVPLFISLVCNLFDSLEIEMLKIAMKFISVIFSSFWVFSYKTFRSWNKLLRPSFSHKGLRNVPVTKV